MNAARQQILRCLAEAGGWLGRAELARAIDYSEQRVDDELAELVMDGTVMFNGRGVEYRLGASAPARKALQQLLASGGKRRVLMTPVKGQDLMRVAVAVRATDYTGGELLTTCEVDMPYTPQDLDSLGALAAQIAAWDRGLQAMEEPAQGRLEPAPAVPARRAA